MLVEVQRGLKSSLKKQKPSPGTMDTVRKFARLILLNLMNVFITELFYFLLLFSLMKNTCPSEGRVVLLSFLV